MLLPLPSSMRAPVTTPAELAGACAVRFPASGSLPRILRGSATRLYRFGACSTFARVASHMIAMPSHAAPYIEVLQDMSVPPYPAPIATS